MKLSVEISLLVELIQATKLALNLSREMNAEHESIEMLENLIERAEGGS